jgi:hypothetical protein
MSTENLVCGLSIKHLQSLVLAVQKIKQKADILLIGFCYTEFLSGILIIKRYELYEITVHLQLVKNCIALMLLAIHSY